MADRLLTDYLQDVRALVRLDADFAAEEERIALARQSSLGTAYGLVREEDSRIAETAEALRTAERRAGALGRRHPVTAVADTAAPADLAACRDALRTVAGELDEIDKADAWLDRARIQLNSARAAQIVVPPAPTAVTPPHVVSQPEAVAAPLPARSAKVAWYWWAAGAGCVCVGAAVLVMSLASGR